MDRVSKRFDNGFLALSEMSLTLEVGEFVSFLGPSGCGKSTALKIIAGLLPQTSGTVEIAPSAAISEHDLGFVFQEPTLMPWANVFDNVFLPLRLAGLPRKKASERVMHILSEVGLSAFTKAFPRELSGGMKMRVSIARALVTQPRILLMDEPFAALDEITRSKLNNDVLRVCNEHKLTVIFVTHSVFEAVFLSNRVFIMASRPGRLVNQLAIDATWPRTEDWKTSKYFAMEARRVSEALKGTIDDSDL